MKPEFKYKKHKSGSSSLEVKGDLLIQYSVEFKEQLAKCLNESVGITISLAEVNAIDVTALQLLHSLRNEMNLNKKVFSVTAPAANNVLDLLKKSGLIKIIENSKS